MVRLTVKTLDCNALGPLMSEPLSSTEIEDVLSSIRRLVSEDMRPLPRAAATAAVVGEKLILTPALRVVQDDETATNPATPMFVAVPRVQLSLPERAADPEPSVLGLVVASVGAAVDAQPEDWEAETGDPQPVTGFHSEASFQSRDWALPAPPIVEPPVVEPVQSEPPLVAVGHFEMVAEAEVEADLPGWAQHEDGAEPPDAADPVIHGSIEPDPVWADAAEASVIASLTEPEAEPDDGFDGMRFDEDVLRELVRDILREELAGRMGERITRNIRKLVRAEIARTLATQNFE